MRVIHRVTSVLPFVQQCLVGWVLPTLFLVFAISIASVIFTGSGTWSIALVYGALLLLSLPCTYFVERFVDLADSYPEFPSLNYTYLIYGASALYSLLYGSAIFIKFYEYDDWVYQALKFQDLSWNYIITPVNDHYVPLLKLLLYVIGTISDPIYFGYALAIYLAGLLLLCTFARVVKQHVGGQLGLSILVLSFAVWPSFETARTWFAGGFWLALPVGFFLICLLAINRIASGRGIRKIWVVLGFAGFATVTSSSQIMIPALFAAVYLLVLLVCASPVQRDELLARTYKIVAVLIFPTVFVFYLRSGHLSHQLDFSGVWNGSYLRGMGSFLSVKVLLAQRWYLFWPYCAVTIGLLIITFCWALVDYRKDRYHKSDNAVVPSLAFTFALAGCGLSMYLFFFLQVGLGRSWEVYASINAYYASFPLTAIALTLAGTGQILLTQLWKGSRSIKRYFSVCGFVVLIAATFISAKKYYPTKDYIQKVNAQRAFVSSFGEAACDFLQNSSSGGMVYLIQAQPYSACNDCEALMMGPKSFLEHISRWEEFTPILAKSLAQHECPNLANRLALTRNEANWSSDGIQYSEKMRGFYKRYFQPLN